VVVYNHHDNSNYTCHGRQEIIDCYKRIFASKPIPETRDFFSVEERSGAQPADALVVYKEAVDTFIADSDANIWRQYSSVNFTPPVPAPSASCSAHPGCAAIGNPGDCCPAISGVFLSCCGPSAGPGNINITAPLLNSRSLLGLPSRGPFEKALRAHSAAFQAKNMDVATAQYTEQSVLTLYNQADYSVLLCSGLTQIRACYKRLFDSISTPQVDVHLEVEESSGAEHPANALWVFEILGSGYERATASFISDTWTAKIFRQNTVVHYVGHVNITAPLSVDGSGFPWWIIGLILGISVIACSCFWWWFLASKGFCRRGMEPIDLQTLLEGTRAATRDRMNTDDLEDSIQEGVSLECLTAETLQARALFLEASEKVDFGVSEKNTTKADFRFMDEIGHGSFGKVYKVKRKIDGRLCVCKAVSVESFKTDKQRMQALSEAKLMWQLNCPYIVAYLEAFIEGGELLLILQYCERGDLLSYLAKTGVLPDGSIWRIFLRVGLALQYLHAKRILHRDVKTENVFLTGSDEGVRVGDLGQAKLLCDDASHASTIMGTPRFLSPEEIAGDPYNDKSDVWSLGVILYELCSEKHRNPFHHIKKLQALMETIAEEDPPALPQHVSDDLRQVNRWLMKRNPKARLSVTQLLANQKVKEAAQAHQVFSALDFSGLDSDALKDGVFGTHSFAPQSLKSDKVPESRSFGGGTIF